MENRLDDLGDAPTRDDIEKLISEFTGKIEEHQQKYPRLAFSFKLQEKPMEQLFEQSLSDAFSADKVAERTDLEKLMYAMIWKQGDVAKIKHIVAGMAGDDAESALVFHQFGKSLAHVDEPIVDQHVLRAFALSNHFMKNLDASCKEDHKARWLKKGQLLKSDKRVLEQYVEWFKSLISLFEENKPEIAYKLDICFFKIGQGLKSQK